jgi:hypothetical protein
MGVCGDQGLTVRAGGFEVHRVELVLAPYGGSAKTIPTDGLLLVVQGGTVPDLDEHAYPAGYDVSPVVHPGWLVPRRDPDVPVH